MHLNFRVLKNIIVYEFLEYYETRVSFFMIEFLIKEIYKRKKNNAVIFSIFFYLTYGYQQWISIWVPVYKKVGSLPSHQLLWFLASSGSLRTSTRDSNP